MFYEKNKVMCRNMKLHYIIFKQLSFIKKTIQFYLKTDFGFKFQEY